ncbi:hypothetical protein [Acinetobacter higginsii]|uniref:hypothetical protein n=1 Tax=Acinetobacter higginsii TaxID=70347 RepID=UPI0026772917|nr:hypothetical protein [Acinetobacter higginsii]MDO3665040.1 hypothetical protein [Acinetobacter higginsii]
MKYQNMKNAISSFFNIFIAFFVFMKEKLFSPIYHFLNKKIYSIGSFGVILIIISIWFSYPSLVQRIDLHLNNEPLTIKDYTKEKSIKESSKKLLTNNDQATSPPVENSHTGYQAVGEKYGTFGDTYGSLNTLFSGLAFAILIITMFIQRQELKEQRIELQLQRKESELGNDIAEMQAKIAENQMKLMQQQLLDTKIQSFNSIFFKYIEEKAKKIEKLKIRNLNVIELTASYDCFRMIRTDLETALDVVRLNNLDETKKYLVDYRFLLENIYSNNLARSGLLEYFIFILEKIEENKDIIDVEKYTDKLCSFCEPDELIFYLLMALENDLKLNILKRHEIHFKVRFTLYRNLYKSLFTFYSY